MDHRSWSTDSDIYFFLGVLNGVEIGLTILKNDNVRVIKHLQLSLVVAEHSCDIEQL